MNPLLVEILSSTWLLDKERAGAYASMLLAMLKGERMSDEDFAIAREKNHSYVTSISTVGRWSLSDSNIPEGSIAVIPIRSEIMKYDQYCGPRGTLSITSDIKAADANTKIKSILLVVDSPGGQVVHTDILAETIKSSKTPVTAFVEGMAASAAYWIVSGAKKIIASSELDRIGSIGTMLFFADLQSYYEEMGVKFHEFYATKSTEKNKDINEVLNGKYDEYRKNTLDKINEKFLGAVKENRPDLSEKTLTGKLFFAREAIDMGLIDEIGTMDYALTEADRMESVENIEESNETLKSDNMKIKMLAAWTAIIAFLGFKSEEIEGKELTQEQVGQLNDELQSRADKITQLEKDLKAENSLKEMLQADLIAEQSAHQVTRKELETLKAEDAGEETTAGKKKDKIEGEPNPADSYAHNKIADEQ